MNTIRELRRDNDPAFVRAWGAIRRFVITLTNAAIWQVTGVMMPDGLETLRAEVFGGIGIAARPPSGVQAEAIGAMVGDANTPTIVAIRDEQTRAASVGDIANDETAVYNSQARVYVKADGTIEARSHAGTAKQLATLDDLAALVNLLAGGGTLPAKWIPVATDGGAALQAAVQAYQSANPTWPAGTSKLKGE